jgi:integrase
VTTTTNNQRIRSPSLAKYIKNVQQANERTAEQYEYRLSKFEKYIVAAFEEERQQNFEQTITLDYIIDKLKSSNNNKIDPYDLLSGFVPYLEEEEGIENPNTIRYFVISARNFLEYYDIEISPRKFRLKVRLPKPVIRYKEALSKEEIREILLKCSNIKLKTYLMLLAATGMRATEALALRHKDFDFDEDNNNKNNRQAFVRIRGEFTKTRTDRYVFLTKEMVEQCKAWIDFKYRRRRITKIMNPSSSIGSGYDSSSGGGTSGKAVSQWVEPTPSPDDIFFSMPRNRKRRSSLRGLYVHMNEEFAKTLDRIGFGNREDGNEKRREITFHSFRRFVKTTISDLGYQDFSEWFIGHAGSTYWRKKDSEKTELFRKIEPYLTFLDITGLESKGADVETRLQERDEQLRSMQNQLGTLFQIMAVEDPEERQKKIVDAAKLWIDKGMYIGRRSRTRETQSQ